MNKLLIINKKKKEFEELLIKTMKDIAINTDKIANSYNLHNDFINFLKNVNIYEKNKWSLIKSEYTFIRNKVAKDKKIIHKIVKILGTISNYYDYDDIENINIKLNKINSDIEIMLYEFAKLKRYHNEIINKCRYIHKCPSVINIDTSNQKIDLMVNIIYTNYINIKLLNQQLYHLSKQQKNLLTQ
jgi:hypothetical protein